MRRFCLKSIITLPVLVWNRLWFSRELREGMNVLSFQFQMTKKEKKICELEMDFKKFFSVAVLI